MRESERLVKVLRERKKGSIYYFCSAKIKATVKLINLILINNRQTRTS